MGDAVCSGTENHLSTYYTTAFTVFPQISAVYFTDKFPT